MEYRAAGCLGVANGDGAGAVTGDFDALAVAAAVAGLGELEVRHGSQLLADALDQLDGVVKSESVPGDPLELRVVPGGVRVILIAMTMEVYAEASEEEARAALGKLSAAMGGTGTDADTG